MIRHQTKTMAQPMISIDHLCQDVQNLSTILIIIIVYRFPSITAGSNVVQRAGKFYTGEV